MGKGNDKGFATAEAILVLIIVAIVGGTGWYVYNSNKKIDETASSAAKSSSGSPSINRADKTDAYAGWKTGTLTYEKLSFRYPDAWTLADDSADNSDDVTLTGTGGFTFHITTGGLGHPGSEIAPTIIESTPVTFAGQPAYLDYAGGTTIKTKDDGMVYTIYLSKSKTSAYDTLPSKNPGQNAGSNGNLQITLTYGYKGKQLSDLQNDANVTDAKLVIASMKY